MLEHEKLNQGRSLLEEVREKLEEQTKLLARDQAKVHYEREELNLLKKKT